MAEVAGIVSLVGNFSYNSNFLPINPFSNLLNLNGCLPNVNYPPSYGNTGVSSDTNLNHSFHSTIQQRNSLMNVRPLTTMNQESIRKALRRKCPTCECYNCKEPSSQPCAKLYVDCPENWKIDDLERNRILKGLK
eukprot:Awhi_evm1s4057